MNYILFANIVLNIFYKKARISSQNNDYIELIQDFKRKYFRSYGIHIVYIWTDYVVSLYYTYKHTLQKIFSVSRLAEKYDSQLKVFVLLKWSNFRISKKKIFRSAFVFFRIKETVFFKNFQPRGLLVNYKTQILGFFKTRKFQLIFSTTLK